MFLGYQRISEIKALKGSTFSLDEGGFTKSVKRIRRELRNRGSKEVPQPALPNSANHICVMGRVGPAPATLGRIVRMNELYMFLELADIQKFLLLAYDVVLPEGLLLPIHHDNIRHLTTLARPRTNKAYKAKQVVWDAGGDVSWHDMTVLLQDHEDFADLVMHFWWGFPQPGKNELSLPTATLPDPPQRIKTGHRKRPKRGKAAVAAREKARAEAEREQAAAAAARAGGSGATAIGEGDEEGMLGGEPDAEGEPVSLYDEWLLDKGAGGWGYGFPLLAG